MDGIFLHHAHKYGALGWAIFPLAMGAKVPMKGSNGLKDASAHLDQIGLWSEAYPGANIAVACGQVSKLIVIDMDPRNGSVETVERLTKEGTSFPDTVEAATPSGGRHLYFGYDPRVRVSGSNRLGPGIDLKTDGGYVVLPPSYWFKVANSYRWLRPPLGREPPKLPRWVIDSLHPRSKPTPTRSRLPSLDEVDGYRRQAIAELQELTDQMATLADGRHQAPFSMACRIGKYHRHGLLTEAEIEQAFLDASASNGSLSKYAAQDLLSQIKNGLRRAVNDVLPPLTRIHRRASSQ